MIKTIELYPGVTLRCCGDTRFKQGCLSFALVRPMCREEAGLNALIPAVLLRGSRKHPNLRAITARLDELYGASISTQVRRAGDYQTTGLYCRFLEDRFAFSGEPVLEPMAEFLRELLLEPVTEAGGFRADYVESEKTNLISTIESEINDKGTYAMNRLLKTMCRADSFGVSRLGEPDEVAAITPVAAYTHYRKILEESRIDIFYVGAAPVGEVAQLMRKLLRGIDRNYVNLSGHTSFQDGGGSHLTEEMDVTQGKLCLGYVTSVTSRDPEFAAMQVMNGIFGSGMISKLFMNVREKLSLCYHIGSGYYSSKGLLTVSAGIDPEKEQQTREEIARQLEAICRGDITELELNAAKETLLSALRSTHDAPGSIEGYYSSAALGGLELTLKEYMDAIRAVTGAQVAEAAKTVKLHSSYFLKGVNQ